MDFIHKVFVGNQISSINKIQIVELALKRTVGLPAQPEVLPVPQILEYYINGYKNEYHINCKL